MTREQLLEAALRAQIYFGHPLATCGCQGCRDTRALVAEPHPGLTPPEKKSCFVCGFDHGNLPCPSATVMCRDVGPAPFRTLEPKP